MARVPLEKTVTRRIGTGVRVVPGAELYVYVRGTTDEAAGYTTRLGSTPVSYPLIADDDGQFTAWYPPGAYDLHYPDDTTNPTRPWQAASGETELGYVQRTSDFTTTSTDPTDIGDLTDTVEVAGPVIVRFRAPGVNTSAGFGAGVILNEDGTDLGVMQFVIGSSYSPGNADARLEPSPGSHTYKLRSDQSAAGTFTIKAGDPSGPTTFFPAYMQIVEV